MSITEPGVYTLTDAEYHADPVPGGSLSSTGARRILDSPARFRWEQTHRVEKVAFDVGHLVHSLVLGTGMEAVEIPADVLATNGAASTKDAKAFIEATRAAGKVPMKADDLAPIRAMAEEVLAHRTARALLERPGASEVSLFAPDKATGVMRRGRIDRLPDADAGSPLAIDLKTARSADPREFRRAVAEHGYHQQAAWYLDLLTDTRGDRDPRMFFIAVETAAPHLVSVCELDFEAMETARRRNREALDTYARCVAADTWPGYGDDVHLIDLPMWALDQDEMSL